MDQGPRTRHGPRTEHQDPRTPVARGLRRLDGMRRIESSSGFSLIEVMVASAILGCAVLSIAQLAAASTRSTAGARDVSEATLLAWQKIDQLRALAWTFDDAGASIDDAALAPSPAGALT